MSRRITFITCAVIMALTLTWGFSGATRASAQSNSFSATTTCWVATVDVNFAEVGDFYIEVVDGEGTVVGGDTFYLVSGTATYKVGYEAIPVDSVTITLSLGTTAGGTLIASPVKFAVDCFEDEGGCDVGMVPEGSVVGLFNWDAETYWMPGELVNPLITLPAGKTAWVLGLDLTRAYYKIVWSCSYLWVRTGTMGPNPDVLWNNTPLPMRTVK